MSEVTNEVITLHHAARLSGLAHSTLRRQAGCGRLAARRSGGTWLTTRGALAAYLAGRRWARRTIALEEPNEQTDQPRAREPRPG
jgi:hypothetical protein